MLPYVGPTLCRTYPTLPYVRPTLCCPTSDLPYVGPILHWTYPTPTYIGPTLCHPMSDLPYIRPILHQTYPTPTYIGPTLHCPMSDLPYSALHQTCPMLVTYPMPTYTYSTPSSLSVCKLSLAATPSAPLLNPQVHERFLLRMVPHAIPINPFQWTLLLICLGLKVIT